jgi:hypothetical protein
VLYGRCCCSINELLLLDHEMLLLDHELRAVHRRTGYSGALLDTEHSRWALTWVNLTTA